jgi:AMP-binding enzyme
MEKILKARINNLIQPIVAIDTKSSLLNISEKQFSARTGYVTHSAFNQSKRSYHSTPISEVEQFTLDVKCLIELHENATKKFGDNKCFGTRVGDTFEWISFKEFGRLVEKFRNVLVHHKIGKNDKVALISNNRVEWAVAFYAVNGVGGQVNN